MLYVALPPLVTGLHKESPTVKEILLQRLANNLAVAMWLQCIGLMGYRIIELMDERTMVRVRGPLWPVSPIVQCIILCNP